MFHIRLDKRPSGFPSSPCLMTPECNSPFTVIWSWLLIVWIQICIIYIYIYIIIIIIIIMVLWYYVSIYISHIYIPLYISIHPLYGTIIIIVHHSPPWSTMVQRWNSASDRLSGLRHVDGWFFRSRNLGFGDGSWLVGGIPTWWLIQVIKWINKNCYKWTNPT